MEESSISTNNSYSYTIRKTTAMLIMRIVIVEVLIMTVHYLVRVLMYAIAKQLNVELSLIALTVEMVIIQVINVSLLMIGVLNWISEIYVLNPKELVVKRGIFSSQATTYEFSNLQSMTVNQSIWGRILNYGNIRLYNPVLREEVIMTNIPSPHMYGSIIQQHNPDITPLIRKRA